MAWDSSILDQGEPSPPLPSASSGGGSWDSSILDGSAPSGPRGIEPHASHKSRLAYAGHLIGLTGESLAKGFADILGMPGDLEALGQAGWNAVVPKAYELEGKGLPTSEETKNALSLGTYFPPQGTGEEYLGAGVEALPQALTGIGMGLKAVPAVAGAISGGLGAKAGGDLAGPVGSVAGGVLGGGFGTLAGAAARQPNIKEVLKQLGSKSKNWEDAGQELKSTTEELNDQYLRKNQDDFVANGRAPGASPHLTPVTFPELEALNWNSLDRALPTARPIYTDINPVMDRLDELVNRQGSLSAATARTKGSAMEQLRDRYDAVTGGTGFADWGDIRGARSEVGDWMRDVKGSPPIGEADKQGLYEAFSHSLGQAAKTMGVDQEWGAANESTKAAEAYRKEVIVPILKSAEPGKYVKSAVSSGGVDSSRLQGIATQMPGVAREITGAMLNEQPKMWQGLNEQAKAALVPEKYLRDQIDEAVSALRTPESPTAHGVGSLRAMEIASAAAGVLSPGLTDSEGSNRLMNAAKLGTLLLNPQTLKAGAKAIAGPVGRRGAALGGVVGGVAPDWLQGRVEEEPNGRNELKP